MPGNNQVTAIRSSSGKYHVWDKLLQVTLCGATIVKKRQVLQLYIRQITCPSCQEKIRENAGNTHSGR